MGRDVLYGICVCTHVDQPAARQVFGVSSGCTSKDGAGLSLESLGLDILSLGHVRLLEVREWFQSPSVESE